MTADESMTSSVRPRTGGKQESVRVIVRCRPLSETEIKQGHQSIVAMHPNRGLVELKNPGQLATEPSKDFTFDAIYNESSKQIDLYDETFRDLVDSVLNGFNGTIFAYGQTGTGKTYTMEGRANIPEERGVIFNCFEHIFQHIAQSRNQQYLVRASYLEIYQEEIRDLLSKDSKARLELKERPDVGVYVKDLSSFLTKSVEEIQGVMSVGNANRSVGRTNMNEHSSRSHAIFMITVECCETDESGENHIRVGRLNLVDLAGSERQAKTGATGERFKEATKINLSLSALGNVISSLVDGKSTHVPYRDSKLTRLLQDSLGGNSKTVMVACIGPASYNFEETLGTLRYANRAKNIKNKPKINEDPKDALLREFQDEISRLRSMLDKRKGGRRGEMDASRGDEYFREERRSLEADKQKVLRDESLVKEERRRIMEALEERERQLEKEREAQARMSEKIKAMESKLLGGTDLVDHTRQQQSQLETRRKELADQKKREREILQQLEKQEDDTAEIHQTFASLQEQLDAQTKKLTKYRLKIRKLRIELDDASIGHSQERQDLERDVAEINKELKLKLLIVDNFIPPEVRERVKERAVWCEEDDNWRLPGARPLSASTRPSTSSDSQGNFLLVEGQGLLTHSIGADSGVSCGGESSSGQRSDYLDKRPISISGLRRPMSSCELMMVERAREQLSRQRKPPIIGMSTVEPILNEDIIRFCGENVLVFSGLERMQSKVVDYDTTSLGSDTSGPVHNDKAVLIDASKAMSLTSGAAAAVAGSGVRSRLRSPSTDTTRSRSKNERARSALGKSISSSLQSSVVYPKARGLYKYHPPAEIGDAVDIMRNALRRPRSIFDLHYTCGSSESSSESEGICADYASKSGGRSMTSSMMDIEMWADRLAPRYGQIRNLDETLLNEWTALVNCPTSRDDGDMASRRSYSVPRSSPALSMMTSSVLGTPRSTRIPRLMSHSYSANGSSLSTPRRGIRGSSCASAPVCGSREQLCEDFVDVRRDARRLLDRSRMKTPIRTAVYDQRCLLPPSGRLSQSMNLSSSHLSIASRHLSPSRPRLLERRPQISRSGDEPVVEKASLELSMLRSQIQGCFGGASRASSVGPTPAPVPADLPTSTRRLRGGRLGRRARNELGGLSPWSMRQLVRWYRPSHTACTGCRDEQRLARLSRRSLPSTVSVPGVAKRNVAYRSRCVCSRVRLPAPLPADPRTAAVSQFSYRTDWAALLAAFALFCRLVLALIPL